MLPKNISVDKDSVEKVIIKAFGNIKSYYRDGQNGWHQFLGSNKVGNIATAQALLCYDYHNKEFLNKSKALQTIIKNQFTSPEKAIDGGWAYATNGSFLPSTEPTCWSLLAILDNSDSGAINKGINWLLGNHPNSEIEDLGWGSTKIDKPRVYSTALAIRVLNRANNTDNQQFIKAKSWLLSAKNKDGGWGETIGLPSSIVHTAHALIALHQCNISSEILEKGCNWLLNQIISDEFWENQANKEQIEYIDITHPLESTPTKQRIVYVHFPVPWAISSLISCNMTNQIQVFKGINWIIENCPNGYWESFEKNTGKTTMWSVHDLLMALKDLKSIFPHWESISKIIVSKSGNVKTETHKSGLSLTSVKNYIKNKIAITLLLVSIIAVILKLFNVITAEQGVFGIIIPLAGSIVANLLTKKGK